uniref:Secreted protein n=1 Tax=Achlya hypogyna TaxID=1202772 RepID=A0A0A7CMW4_ACHHY|nr:secreted protein [Achlya hypogyna]
MARTLLRLGLLALLWAVAAVAQYEYVVPVGPYYNGSFVRIDVALPYATSLQALKMNHAVMESQLFGYLSAYELPATDVVTSGFAVTTNFGATGLEPSLYAMLNYVVSIDIVFYVNASAPPATLFNATAALNGIGLRAGQTLPQTLAQAMFGVLAPAMSANNVLLTSLAPPGATQMFTPLAPYISLDLELPAPLQGAAALDVFFFQTVEFAAAAALEGYHATWVHAVQATKLLGQPLLDVTLLVGLDNGVVNRDTLHLAFDDTTKCGPIFEANNLTFLGPNMYTMNVSADGIPTSWYGSYYGLYPSAPKASHIVALALSFGKAFNLQQVEAFAPAAIASLASDLKHTITVADIVADTGDVDTPTAITLILDVAVTDGPSSISVESAIVANNTGLLQDVLTALQLPPGMLTLALAPNNGTTPPPPGPYFDFSMDFVQVAPTSQLSPVFDLQRGLCALAGAGNLAVPPSHMEVSAVSKSPNSYLVTWFGRIYLQTTNVPREEVAQAIKLNIATRLLFNNRPGMSLLSGFQDIKFNLGADGYVSWFNSVVFVPPYPLNLTFAHVHYTFNGSLCQRDLEVQETNLLGLLVAASTRYASTADVATVHSKTRNANDYAPFVVSFRVYANDTMNPPEFIFADPNLLAQLGALFSPNPVLVSLTNYTTSYMSNPELPPLPQAPYFTAQLQYYDANPVPINSYDAFFFRRVKLAIAEELGWNSTANISAGVVSKASGSYLVFVSLTIELAPSMDRMALSGPLQTTLAGALAANGVGDQYDGVMLDLTADGYILPQSFFQQKYIDTPPDLVSPNDYVRVTVSFTNVTFGGLSQGLPGFVATLTKAVGANASQLWDINTNVQSIAQAGYFEARILLFAAMNGTLETTNITSALVNPMVVAQTTTPGLPPFGLVGIEVSSALPPMPPPMGPYVFLYLTLYQSAVIQYSALDYERMKLAVASAAGLPANTIVVQGLHKAYNSNAMQWSFLLPLLDGSATARSQIEAQVQLSLPEALAAFQWPTNQTILGIDLNLYADGYTTYQVTSAGDLFLQRQRYPLTPSPVNAYVHATDPHPTCNAFFCLQLAFTSAYWADPFVLTAYETKHPVFSNAFAPGSIAPVIDGGNATVWQIWPTADANPAKVDVVLHLSRPESFGNTSDDLVVRVIAQMMSPTTAASSVTVVSHTGAEAIDYYSLIAANNVLSLNLDLHPYEPPTSGGNATLNQYTLPSVNCALCQNLFAQTSNIYCLQNQILTPGFITQTVQNYLPGFTRDITTPLQQCQNTTNAASWANFQIAASCMLSSGCPLAPFLPNTSSMAVLYSNDPVHTVMVMASAFQLQLEVVFNGIAITPVLNATNVVPLLTATLQSSFAPVGVVPKVTASWSTIQNAWTIQIQYQNLMSQMPILSVYNPNAQAQPPVSISTSIKPYYAVEVLPYNTSVFSPVVSGMSAQCSSCNAHLMALNMTDPEAFSCLNLPDLADRMANNISLWFNNSQFDVSDAVANCLQTLPSSSWPQLTKTLQCYLGSPCPVATPTLGNITLVQPFAPRQTLRAPQGSYINLQARRFLGVNVLLGNQSVSFQNVVASTDPRTLSKALSSFFAPVAGNVAVQIYSTPEFDPVTQAMSVFWYVLLQYTELVGPLPKLVINSNAPVAVTNVAAPMYLQLSFARMPTAPGPTATSMGLQLIPLCQRCDSMVADCDKNSDCSGAMDCMSRGDVYFENPAILLSQSYPLNYTTDLAATLDACYKAPNVSLVGWQMATSFMRCYASSGCPITEDVSSTRMVTAMTTTATQTIQALANEIVNLQFYVKGNLIGGLYSIGSATVPGNGSTLAMQLGFLSNITTNVTASTSLNVLPTQSVWTLVLTYFNAVGPLPTIQVSRNVSAVSVFTSDPAPAFQVVPYNLNYFQVPSFVPASLTPSAPTGMVTMCDECHALMQTSCGPDPACQNALAAFRGALNPSVLLALNANATVDISGLVAASVSAKTPLRAASVFGLYHSCLALYQCPVQVMPAGSPAIPVLKTTPEVHVVQIFNSSPNFNITLSYPNWGVVLPISGDLTAQALNLSLQNQWNASLLESAYYQCMATGCVAYFSFPNLVLPLALPVVNGSVPVNVYKAPAATQTISVLPTPNWVDTPPVLLSPLQSSCAANPGCQSILSCWASPNASVVNATANLRDNLPFYSTLNLTANNAYCIGNTSLTNFAPYAAWQNCLLSNACPVQPTLGAILAGRSVVATASQGVQTFLVSGALTASVSLQFNLLGTNLGGISYVSLYTSPSVLSSQLQGILGSLATVSMSTFQANASSWYIQIAYNNYVGPLPNVTLISTVSASLASSTVTALTEQVIPYTSYGYGFPYLVNAAPAPTPTPALATYAPVATPLPNGGVITYPPTTTTPVPTTVNATVTTTSTNMSTVCDECNAFLTSSCLSDVNCTALLTSYRSGINASVLALLNGTSNATTAVTSVLAGTLTPIATTALRSMSPFASYLSCMSFYQCALNTTSVNGSTRSVMLSTTPEVPNTTAIFNATVAYPALNVSLVVSNNATLLNYTLQSQWNVSLAPTAVLTCASTCSFTFTFPNLGVPLALPTVTSSFATATAARSQQATQSVALLSSNLTTTSALVLGATCNYCVSQFAACSANTGCATMLNYWRLNASIAATLNALQASPTATSVNATANNTIAMANQTYTSVQLFASATNCLITNACPVAADLSTAANITSILANRMIVPVTTTATQTLFLNVSLGANVSVQLSLLGQSLGNLTNITYSTSVASLAATVQSFIGGMGQVSVSAVNTSSAAWALTISYANYVAALPTLSVTGATLNTTSTPSSFLYQVVPFNVGAFGFPYKPNTVTTITTGVAVNNKCQGCLALASVCSASSPCATLMNCVANATTANFTTALASSPLATSVEYTTPFSACIANASYAAWSQYAAYLTCNDINACPLLSTTTTVAAGRMLTPNSLAATQKIQVNTTALSSVNMNIKFAVGSTYVGALLNITSTNSTATLTSQLQTAFASVATVTATTYNDTSAWYIGLTYSNYYGPLPSLTIYGTNNYTTPLSTSSREFVTVQAYNPLSYYPN